MSTSHEFGDHILDLLSPIGNIQTQRMFGGVLIKIDNKQLGVILMDTLYFKVKEPELQEKYQKMDSVQFEYSRKDMVEPVIIKNWWSVPEEIIENKEELIALAYEVLLQGK